MITARLQRRIAAEAARLLYAREESAYFRAKMRAARRVAGREPSAADLPTNREVREQIRALARKLEGRRRRETLHAMRADALRLMQALAAFAPRLIGGAASGHVGSNARIRIHVFAGELDTVTTALDGAEVAYHARRSAAGGGGAAPASARIRIENRFPLELAVYAADMADHVFRNPITGRALEQAGIAALEQLLAQAATEKATEEGTGTFCPKGPADAAHKMYPTAALPHSLPPAADTLDRFLIYERLLLLLEEVKEDPAAHPEGDVLYHSLQVFALAREKLPYDEEFLLAALLHDVGKAIDRREHVAAGLEALQGLITPRTAWLIEHHVEALAVRNGTLGVRSRRRLDAAESFEELMLLAECDAAGRQVGVAVPDAAEALLYLRELDESCSGS